MLQASDFLDSCSLHTADPMVNILEGELSPGVHLLQIAWSSIPSSDHLSLMRVKSFFLLLWLNAKIYLVSSDQVKSTSP